jgi:hypothetical protein
VRGEETARVWLQRERATGLLHRTEALEEALPAVQRERAGVLFS